MDENRYDGGYKRKSHYNKKHCSPFKKRLSYKKSWREGPKEGSKAVSKGQELAYFKMGSTVILLFPEIAKLNINSLYLNKAVKFGEKLAEIESD